MHFRCIEIAAGILWRSALHDYKSALDCYIANVDARRLCRDIQACVLCTCAETNSLGRKVSAHQTELKRANGHQITHQQFPNVSVLSNPVVAAFGTAHEIEFSGRVPTLGQFIICLVIFEYGHSQRQ